MKKRAPDQPAKPEPALNEKAHQKSIPPKVPPKQPDAAQRNALVSRDIELISKKLAIFGNKGIQSKTDPSSPPPKKLATLAAKISSASQAKSPPPQKQLGRNPKTEQLLAAVAVDEIQDSVNSLEEIDEESTKPKPKGVELDRSDESDYSKKPPIGKAIRVVDLLGEEPPEPIRKSNSRAKKSNSPNRKVVTKPEKKATKSQAKPKQPEAPAEKTEPKKRTASKKKITEAAETQAKPEEAKGVEPLDKSPKIRASRAKKLEGASKPVDPEVTKEPASAKRKSGKKAKESAENPDGTQAQDGNVQPATVGKRNRSKAKPQTEAQQIDDLLKDPLVPEGDCAANQEDKPKKDKKKSQKSTIVDDAEKEKLLATTVKVNFSGDYATTKVTFKHPDNREFTTKICDFLTEVLAKPMYGREPPKLEEGFTTEEHIYYDIPSSAYYPDLLKHLSLSYTLEFPRTLKEYFHVKPEGVVGELNDEDNVVGNNDFEFSTLDSNHKKSPQLVITTGDGRSPPPVLKGVKIFQISKRPQIEAIIDEVAAAKKAGQRIAIQVENWETMERSLKGLIFGLLIKPQLANDKGMVNEFPLLESRYLVRPDPTEVYTEDRFTVTHELRIAKTPNTHAASFQTISEALANKDQVQLIRQVCKFTKQEPKQVLRELELSLRAKLDVLGQENPRYQTAEEKLSKMVSSQFKQTIELVKAELIVRELNKELLKFKRVIIFAANKESMKELGASITRNLLRYGVTLIEHDTKKSIQQINEQFLSVGKTIMIYPMNLPKSKLRGLNFDLAIILDSFASSEQVKDVKALVELNAYQNDRTLIVLGIDTPLDIEGATKLGAYFNLAEDSPVIATEMNVLKKNPMNQTTQKEKFKLELLTPIKETKHDAIGAKSPNPKGVLGPGDAKSQREASASKPVLKSAPSAKQVVAPISTTPTLPKGKKKPQLESKPIKAVASTRGPVQSKIVDEESDDIKIGVPSPSSNKDHLKSLKSTAETKSSARIVKGTAQATFFEESVDIRGDDKHAAADELDDFELEPKNTKESKEKISADRRGSLKENALSKRSLLELEVAQPSRNSGSREKSHTQVNQLGGKLRKITKEDSESDELGLTTKDSGKVELRSQKGPSEPERSPLGMRVRNPEKERAPNQGPVYGNRSGAFFR